MEYTVKALADLSGVTPRALRWYDKTGLLRPERTTPAGYRIYGPRQVDRLQQILFYRALGLSLEEIGRLLDDPGFHRPSALRGHLETLLARRARLDALILTVRSTLNAEEGGIVMSDLEKFKCFKQNVIKENEETYGGEVRAQYGDAVMDQANARIAGLTPGEYWAMTALEEDIRARLEQAVQAGAEPGGVEGAALAGLHKLWLSYSWDARYTPQAHRGLAQTYVADPRFTAYYDKNVPGCARFLHDAILCHIS